MKAKPNYNRIHINIPADISDWLEKEAMRQTIAGGGHQKRGGKGITWVSDIIVQLVRAEKERETRRLRMTVDKGKEVFAAAMNDPLCHNDKVDPLTDVNRDPDWTIAVEGKEEPCLPESPDSSPGI